MSTGMTVHLYHSCFHNSVAVFQLKTTLLGRNARSCMYLIISKNLCLFRRSDGCLFEIVDVMPYSKLVCIHSWKFHGRLLLMELLTWVISLPSISILCWKMCALQLEESPIYVILCLLLSKCLRLQSLQIFEDWQYKMVFSLLSVLEGKQKICHRLWQVHCCVDRASLNQWLCHCSSLKSSLLMSSLEQRGKVVHSSVSNSNWVICGLHSHVSGNNHRIIDHYLFRWDLLWSMDSRYERMNVLIPSCHFYLFCFIQIVSAPGESRMCFIFWVLST